MPHRLLASALLSIAIQAIGGDLLQIQNNYPSYSGDLSGEGQDQNSEDMDIMQYRLDLSMCAVVVSSAVGACVGGFMMGAACMARPENINHAVCKAGIVITSLSGAGLVVGVSIVSSICLYKRYCLT